MDTVALFNDKLTKQETDRITKYMVGMKKRGGTNVENSLDNSYRSCCVRHRPCPVWLNSILSKLVDIKGCRFDHMQLTHYGVGDHYNTWHTDSEKNGSDAEDARVFTFIIMLSPCIKGGLLQFLDNNDVHSISLKHGDIVVFNSRHAIHRVTAILEGTRRTAVVWAVND